MLDAQTIGACPDFLSISGMFKAHASVEDGRRIVYFEASNEGLDQQGEVIAAEALAKSIDYFRRYGIIDLDHYSQIGAKLGIPNYSSYEIGRPSDVGQRDGSTYVKADIYQGDTPVAEKANMFWATLTELSPPQRWYPSVAGSVLGKATEVDELGQRGKTLITSVRWAGVGLSKTPVNQHVSACTTMPIGVFAKCWSASGLDIAQAMSLSKTLTAGYGTDSATLVGGAALREQSLDPKVKDTTVGNYFDFRERMAGALRSGECGPSVGAMHAYATTQLGLPQDRAAQHVERFCRDLNSHSQRKAA